MKKLVKKLIVVLRFTGLTGREKLLKMETIQEAHVEHPTVVPGLDPTAAAVGTKLNTLQGYYDTQDSLKLQMDEVNEQIASAETELIDIYVDKWAGQVQTAAAGDKEVPKSLGYGVKGDDDSKPDLSATQPLITDIDISVHGVHTVFVINKDSKKKKLPKGAIRVDMYGQTGGNPPADLAELIANGGGYLGEAIKGKFKHTLPQGATGKFEYYIAVYIDSKTKKPASYSVVASAIIS